MIVPDLNLLLYAYNPGAVHHARAREWWEGLLNGEERVGLPWMVILGFVRLSTTRGVLAVPVAPGQAMDRITSWLERPDVFILLPGPRHLEVFRRTVSATAGGAMTTDAHLAALAIENQAELHSNDGDFARLEGLRWLNPLS